MSSHSPPRSDALVRATLLVGLCAVLASPGAPALRADGQSTEAGAEFVAAQRRAQAWIEADRADLALEILERLRTLRPDDSITIALIGEAHWALEDPVEAIRHFERALEMAPELRGKLFHLGLAYVSSGRMQEASGVFDALAASPERHVQAKGEFGRGLVAIAEGAAARAEERLLAAIEKNPAFIPAHYRLGQLLLDGGQLVRARAEFAAVIEQDALHHGAVYNLGIACERLGDAAEARRFAEAHRAILAARERISLLESLIRHDPKVVRNYAALGAIYLEHRRFAHAARWLEQGIEVDASVPEIHLALARAYEGAGDEARARESYERVVREFPGAEEAEAARQAWKRLGGG